jgi:hypothetical protein
MKYLIALISLIALAACEDSSSSGPVPNGQVVMMPTSISARALIGKPALTQYQIQEIQALLWGSYALPDKDLFFGTRREREERSRNLSGSALQVYNSIASNCEFQSPGVVNGVPSIDSVSTIMGNNCPIALYSSAHRDESVQNDSNGRQNRINESSHAVTQIASMQMRSVTGLVSSDVSATSTTLQVFTSDRNASKYVTSSSVTTLQTMRGQTVTINGSMESLRTRGSFEAYTELTFSLPSSNPTIQVIQPANDRKHIYLNGQEVSAGILKQIFGPGFEINTF